MWEESKDNIINTQSSERTGKYACLLEGDRRVGKTTIAEEFARNEYDFYILIDFSNISKEMLDVFKDIARLDRFFLRLQMETGVELYERKSVIIFDEIMKNFCGRRVGILMF